MYILRVVNLFGNRPCFILPSMRVVRARAMVDSGGGCGRYYCHAGNSRHCRGILRGHHVRRRGASLLQAVCNLAGNFGRRHHSGCSLAACTAIALLLLAQICLSARSRFYCREQSLWHSCMVFNIQSLHKFNSFCGITYPS